MKPAKLTLAIALGLAVPASASASAEEVRFALLVGNNQGERAERSLRFAEEGLTAARQANDRDSENYMQELAAAARKQIG